MSKLAQELEGGGKAGWAGVGYVQMGSSTDQRDCRDACSKASVSSQTRTADAGMS